MTDIWTPIAIGLTIGTIIVIVRNWDRIKESIASPEASVVSEEIHGHEASVEMPKIIQEIISRDTHKVWSSSCHVISTGQDRNSILPLIEYLPVIREKTKNLEMGGAFAPNQRFIDFAIRTIEFHRDCETCPCCLYLEHGVDPNNEVSRGNVSIANITRIDGKWIDFYDISCTRCNQKYKVIERDSHFKWWKWSKI